MIDKQATKVYSPVMNYAHALQDLRKREGLTQAQAAELLGYKWYAPVQRMESGKASITPQTQMLIKLWERHGSDALRALR